jgi:probable F420-dependent oxidoreductase
MQDVQFAVQLPTERVDAGSEFLSADAISELARTAEASGFDACYVTDHPFPSDKWLADGGHHALDPFVALSFAAAATTTLRLQTNIAVLAYRNPFITAKAAASLDVLSGGRLILGVAAGYLKAEFDALGADFAHRNELTDEAIIAIKRAWSEEGVVGTGSAWEARGNTMLPQPIQQPHPPIWIGGNSKLAIRRAVDHAEGWIPFPTIGIDTDIVRTAAIRNMEDLVDRIAYANRYIAETGREAPLDICFVPFGFTMPDLRDIDAARFLTTVEELAYHGVTWLTLLLPGRTRAEYCDAMHSFGADVLAKVS